jgi:hypothetical protein
MARLHCYCNLTNATRGGLVEPDDVNIGSRDGIPVCSDACGLKYDRDKEAFDRQRTLRRSALAGHVTGNRHSGLARI